MSWDVAGVGAGGGFAWWQVLLGGAQGGSCVSTCRPWAVNMLNRNLSSLYAG